MIKKKHIKKCKENSKKQNKIKKKAIVLESTDLSLSSFKEQWMAEYDADTSGWVQNLKLIASKKGQWNPSLKGRALVELNNFDGDVRLTINKMSGNQVIELSLGDLADILLIGKLLNKLNNDEVFCKHKVKVKK